MSKFLFSLSLLCILCQAGHAQDKVITARVASIPAASCASVDDLAAYIKQNFSTDEEKLNAIFLWVANNINYDVPRMRNAENNPGGPPQPVADVLFTRNAVCEGYSELFVALCKGVGINAIVVPGYTKKQGKIGDLPHAWVAAPLGAEWYLFDPTWGAGFVRDDQFTRRLNNSFYKVRPENFIADHMPFDPMYQFLSQPLTNKEFTDGTHGGNKNLFNYADTLKQNGQLSTVQQAAAELRRLEAGGVQNDLLRKRELYLKNVLQSFASKESFTEGNKIFMSAQLSFKEYIGHKNKHFTTIADNDLRQLVDSIEQKTRLSRSLFSAAVSKTDAQSQAKANSLDNVDKFWARLLTEKEFTAHYLAADKDKRIQMFRK